MPLPQLPSPRKTQSRQCENVASSAMKPSLSYSCTNPQKAEPFPRAAPAISPVYSVTSPARFTFLLKCREHARAFSIFRSEMVETEPTASSHENKNITVKSRREFEVPPPPARHCIITVIICFQKMFNISSRLYGWHEILHSLGGTNFQSTCIHLRAVSLLRNNNEVLAFNEESFGAA